MSSTPRSRCQYANMSFVEKDKYAADLDLIRLNAYGGDLPCMDLGVFIDNISITDLTSYIQCSTNLVSCNNNSSTGSAIRAILEKAQHNHHMSSLMQYSQFTHNTLLYQQFT